MTNSRLQRTAVENSCTRAKGLCGECRGGPAAFFSNLEHSVPWLGSISVGRRGGFARSPGDPADAGSPRQVQTETRPAFAFADLTLWIMLY
jgi:hypothetical protein